MAIDSGRVKVVAMNKEFSPFSLALSGCAVLILFVSCLAWIGFNLSWWLTIFLFLAMVVLFTGLLLRPKLGGANHKKKRPRAIH
jgi:membrane protein implicated in regulation of membrane protease activity